MNKRKYVGFGFNIEGTEHHFYVNIPREKQEPIRVYERFFWDKDGEQIIRYADILKIEFPHRKWDILSGEVTRQFNKRLKEENLPAGKFKIGWTPLDRLMGKELMVLLWSLEGREEKEIQTALSNWSGLYPEERWWLYTMTNASAGEINDSGKGWRMALKYAMCGNPV